MKYRDLEEIMRLDDLFNIIFEKDGFSFNENIIIDQLSIYEGRDFEEVQEDARKFGCIIKDDDVILPAGLRFKINKTSHKNDPALFYIERNGVEFPISYMEDTDIGVIFTEFGQKLYSYSKSIYTTIPDAYNKIQLVETIFGVKIIE